MKTSPGLSCPQELDLRDELGWRLVSGGTAGSGRTLTLVFPVFHRVG